jgi:hypothetical protein
MRVVVVLLALFALAFMAFCIWQLRSAVETKRREDREREREQQKWTDDMLRGDE